MKRYVLVDCGELHEASDGEWVRFDEHAAALGRAEAERDALKAEVTRLRFALERLLPFLPTLDDGPVRFSEHARAAQSAREALAADNARLRAENTRLAMNAESEGLHVEDYDRTKAENARLRAALEAVKSGLGDRLLAKGPLSVEYAHAVMREVNQALEKMSPKGIEMRGEIDALKAERDAFRAALTKVQRNLKAAADFCDAEITEALKAKP